MAGGIVTSSIDGKFGELVDRVSWVKSKKDCEGISRSQRSTREIAWGV